uniref:Transmembrane emp24 domain-containing protein 4 n=1 Tax=Schistosoma japonicum TaxID=6182 RepID=C1LNJ6_SCHJA|nr:Transmembrane emp24 domain-containing protein 4 precursor [Schistosoma japonicum]
MLHTYLVAFSLCIGLSQSIFFHMKETEERCFLEDVPEDTLVAGRQLFGKG